MNIYQLLKKQHREVSALFKQIEKAQEKEPATVAALFNKVKVELGSHAKAEEEVFYTPIRLRSESEEGEELSSEGKEEHHVIALLLGELSRLSVNTEEWKAKFTVLKEIVEHHVEEEENEIFAAAREIFSAQEARDIAEQMLRKQTELKPKVNALLLEDTKIFSKPEIARDTGSDI